MSSHKTRGLPTDNVHYRIYYLRHRGVTSDTSVSLNPETE